MAARPDPARLPRQRPAGKPVDRRRTERWGRLSELIAAAWLIFTGHRLLAWGYRTHAGEIDLVVRKGNIIAFVEVKARRSLAAARDAVGGASAARIRAASLIWLARHPQAHGLSYRHDIVAIRPFRLPVHYRDAF